MFRKLMISVAGLATVACMALPGVANAEGFRRFDRDDVRCGRYVREYRVFHREPIRRFERHERFEHRHGDRF